MWFKQNDWNHGASKIAPHRYSASNIALQRLAVELPVVTITIPARNDWSSSFSSELIPFE